MPPRSRLTVPFCSLLLGLAKYDAMCQAIVACASVDEVKDIRDKARALEVYAHQAQNEEVEIKAAEIRIRAERKAGELLKETEESGARASGHENLKYRPSTESTNFTPLGQPISQETLADLGITKYQSATWQKLAEIPEEKFSDPEVKPTTHGTVGIPVKLNAHGSRTAFRDDPEHHRSVATLASRLCGKVFGFVKRNLSEAQRRMDAASGERGAGKGAAALVPAQRWRDPERESAPSERSEDG